MLSSIHHEKSGLIEPTAMKLSVMVIIGGLVAGIFAINYSSYRESRKINEFIEDTEGLVKTIRSLKSQDPKTKIPLEIKIPKNFSLIFENTKVRVSGGYTRTFDAEIELSSRILCPGTYHLLLKRTRSGVRITEWPKEI